MIDLPKVLKNMNLFVDGRGYAGRVDEIQLPKLALKTEEHRAGGMDAPIEIELGMEKLEAELTVSDYDAELFRLFGLLESRSVPLTLRGAVQAQGQPQAQPVVVQLQGGIRSLEPSAWKPGDKSTIKASVAAHYYKLSINGADLIEIDLLNLVRRVGGVDQLASVRQAIGV
ncbi:MAG: phage major tail tube protein [Rhodocyclaceae bacterium]|nr:phage major tail tube protein [Rhodocyclaceae bacterium]